MKSPFKFLDAYTKDDREVFFGRDREIEELYHRAFESRIIMVYGESGTGKSSLVLCGLANKFRDTDWLPLMIRRGENIMDSIGKAVKYAAVTPQTYELFTTVLFKKAIRSLYADHYKPIYFIFDQFEELFIFGTKEEKHAFVQLMQALSESDIECRFIFIMREEYMASVTEFEKHIHGFLSNRLRIEKMPYENALQAIKGPCSVLDIEVEDGFPEKLLNKLSPDSPDIELTYLQVFLDKIWNLAAQKQEKDRGQIRFSSDLLEKTGDVSDLLASFLEDQVSLMADQDTALAVLKSFVSVKGTKRQLNPQEVKENTYTLGRSINEPVLLEMIQKFVQLRILRDKDQGGRYELRHDALAMKIFEKISLIEKEILEIRQFVENAFYNWQRRNVLLSEDDLKYIAPYRSRLYLSSELSSLIERSERALEGKRRRRRQLAIAIPGIVIITLSAFTIWALLERRKSDRNYIMAKANNYGMMAREIALTDPTKALRLAEYAMSLDSTEDVRKIMYQIYRENSFYKIIARLPGPVNAIALSPKCEYILTGCGDGIARLMDLNGKFITEYKAHRGAINAVAFSPTGDSILTGSSDNTVILWSINGNMIQKFVGHSGFVISVAFSSDGRNILTGSNDNTARLWDITGTLLHKYSQEFYCRAVSFSEDGKSFLTNADSLSPGIITLNGKRVKTFTGHTRAVQKAIFSPDYKSVLSTSTDGTAILFDLDGKIKSRFIGHTNRTQGVAFSPDGMKLLTTSEDNTIRVWNLDGEVIQVLKGHEDNVSAATFSSDGEIVFSVSADGTVRSWELQNNTQLLFTVPKELGVRDVRFSKESNTILMLRNYCNSTLFDFRGNIIHDFWDPEGRIGMQRISDDGRTIISGGYAAWNITWIRLWNTKGKELGQFKNSSWAGIISDSVVYTFNNQLISFYDLNGKLISQFKCPAQEIYPFPFQNSFLYGTNEGIVWQTDINGNRLMEFSGHKRLVRSISFSSDTKMILTGSDDRTAILWNTEGKPLQVYREHTGEVYSVAFSPKDNLVLTLDKDGVARLWDLKGNLVQTFKTETLPPDPLVGAFFSDEGRKILTVSRFADVRLTDILKPLDDFRKKDNYEELGVRQMIELGIMSFKDMLKLNDPTLLSETADWYFANSSISETGKKEEYLKNTFKLFDKISEISPDNLDFLLQKLRIYSELYRTDQSAQTITRVSEINNRILNLKSPDDNFKALNFYLGFITNFDSTLKDLKFDEYFIRLCDKITNSRLASAGTSAFLLTLRQNSLTMLRNNQNKLALKGFEVCMAADSTSEYHLCFITMAYILNDQFGKAARLFNKWKDVPIKGYESQSVFSFRDGFLWWIRDFENNGFKHPDFEKAKELLKK